jgi:hypothetical protein
MQVSVKGFTKKPVDLLTFVNDPAMGKSTDGGHVKICEVTRFCASFIEACSNIGFADSPCERDLWKGSARSVVRAAKPNWTCPYQVGLADPEEIFAASRALRRFNEDFGEGYECSARGYGGWSQCEAVARR